jgi:hypothetical protein
MIESALQLSSTMFRHRHQVRRWAARVLLLWLFGLGAGIAHACLTPSPTAVAAVAVAVADEALAPHHHAAADPASHHRHLAPSAQDGLADHHGTIAKTNCQDFCSKATVSIPSLKSALDDVHAHALMATVFTTTALPLPAFAAMPLWVPRRDGVKAPPIPIAFLRLAL